LPSVSCSTSQLCCFQIHIWSQYLHHIISGCGKTLSSHILRPAHIYNRTQQSPILRLCSAYWGWASNARNMSRLWTSIKWKSEVCIKLVVLITKLCHDDTRSTKH
jgi:hypothetical protein